MSNIEKVQEEYKHFSEKFESIVICTTDAEGIPNASYAPFVMDEAKNIYIYVSGLSQHTKNLYTKAIASVLFIEDEAMTKQIFARRRLTYDCTAALIERELPQWEQIVNQFQNRFGEIIELFRSLPDFRIFQLTPTQGRFVVGFGGAYEISGDNLDRLVQVTGS